MRAPAVAAAASVPAGAFDDRGADFDLGGSDPAILVFGFAPQPVLLASNGVLPCILLPAVDVPLFVTGPFHLPLPAAVRPARSTCRE